MSINSSGQITITDLSDGNDGVGIKTTVITYAISTNGTTAPTTGWTSSVPSLVKGQHLWTKTVWTYTDNTSETGYSVTYISKDGNNGKDAISVILSNENVTLPANAQGGVTSYANSGTTLSVFVGNTAWPYGTGANKWTVAWSASGATRGTGSNDGTLASFNNISGMSDTSGATATQTFVISVNVGGTVTKFTKVQNINKAEKGITGDDGIDSYTYIRYSASSNGASMTSLPNADSQYIGTCTTTQAIAPTTAGSYVWAKFVGENGAKGDPTGITRSTTEPATRYTGMLWQYTGTVNLAATGITASPSSLYVWTGSAWQLYLVKSKNLQVDNGFITNAMIANAAIDNAKIKDATIESAKIKSLNADKIITNNLSSLSANLGDINGGTLKLMADDILINGRPKMYGIYQSKLGLISSGPTFETARSGLISDTQMGVVSVNKGEMRFIVTDYTEDLKTLQASGMSDQNNAFIKFASYEGGNDTMTIGSSGDIVFKGNTSQDTPWVTLSSGIKYKFMFSRVYISVNVVGNGNQFMDLGTLPQNLRPITDQFLIIANWGTGTADDRHIMARASDGKLILWEPKSGVTYAGEVSYTL